MELDPMGRVPEKRTKGGQQEMVEALVKVAEREAAVWAEATVSGTQREEEQEG
jgi:hypothetical protein